VAAASSAVADVARALGIKRHLCMLPLAVLLEQVAGAEAAWQADAECVLVPLAEVGVSGSSGFDARRALGAIERWQPQSLILLPQMLLALVEAVESAAAAGRGCAALRSLRLAAVGGGRVSPELIARARRLGIPACEGYGLTECASVVALAAPDDPPGSGMRMLGHARARIDRSGEILIEGPGFAGYLGQASRNGIDVPDAAAPVRTGDLGSLDAGGRLRVTGRIKHQLITGFGRNVSPEWPEAELAAQPAIRQVAVFGEGRPWLCAVIVPSAGADPASIAAAVARANDALPDYARIGGWIAAADGCNGFTPANGLATGNGRLRRDAILARHADRIDRLYLEHPAEVHDVVP
jgi:acyl-CoA synthetase (AMP-forming)/AMP-acid ligase II